MDFRARVQRCETALLCDALQRADWNQSEAARQLRIPLRTLFNKIHSYGISKNNPSCIKLMDLPEEDRRLIIDERATTPAVDFRVRIQYFEEALIRRAMKLAGQNHAQAARYLRIPMSTLLYKLRSLSSEGDSE